MARVLRKLIKQARKDITNKSIRRINHINKYGSRFNVEELEERIAPATIPVVSGELAVWDADATDPDAFVNDGDGLFFMWENDAGGLQANISMGDTSTSLTEDAGKTTGNGVWVSFESATLANNTVITVATNGWLGNVDLSNLTIDNGNTATINIVSGTQFVFDNETPDQVDTINADGSNVITTGGGEDITAYDDSVSTIGIANVDSVVDGDDTVTELVDAAGIGTITLPTVASGESANLVLNVSAGGGDGSGNSSDGSITAITDNSSGTLTIADASDIYCDEIGNITVDAMAGTVDIEGGTGTVTGDVAVAGAVATLQIAGALGDSSTADTFTVGDNLGTLTVATDIMSDITVTGDVTTITATNGDIDGDITVNLDAGTIQASGGAKDINGTVDVEGTLTTITAGTNIGTVSADTIGTVTATSGNIGSLTTTDTSVTANITDGDGTIGDVTAGGDLGTITTSDGTTTLAADVTSIDITGDVTGALNIDGTITGIYIGGDLSGVITLPEALNITVGTGGNFTANEISIAGSITGTGGFVVTGGYDASDTFDIDGDMDGKIDATTGNIAAAIDIAGELGSTSGVVNIRTVASGADIVGAITIGTNLAGTIQSADEIQGAITLANGDLTGTITAENDITAAADITLTDGRLSGTIQSTSGGIAGDVSIGNGTDDGAGDDDGVLSGSILANDTTNGTITGDISIAEGIAGASGAIATIKAYGNIDDAAAEPTITITDGGMNQYSLIESTNGSIANITLNDGDGDDAQDGLDGDITAGAAIGNITVADGDIDANAVITAGTQIGAIDVQDGNIDGTIEAGTSITSVTVTNDTADSGETTVTDDGNVTNTITAGTDIGAIEVADTLSNVITAGENFTGTIDVGSDANTNAVTTGGITSAGKLIATANDFQGLVKIWDGGMAGEIKATAGNITGGIQILDTVDTDDDGTLTGTIRAGADISGVKVDIADGITSAGSVTAGDDISAEIEVDAGGMAGTISASDNITTQIDITGGVTGTIKAVGNAADGDGNAGDFAGLLIPTGNLESTATLTIAEDLTGAITVSTGTIELPITIPGNTTAAISATDINAAINVTGNIGANIDATLGTGNAGNITSITAGTIDSGDAGITIQADDGIGAITVTNSIGTSADGNQVTINADVDGDNTGDIASITAGGLISIDADAENIGTITTGGGNIDNDTTITAVKDIDGIDAGTGNIENGATITAGQVSATSPLAWFVDEGVVYVVWALNQGTTDPNTTVTADITFTAAATNTLAIAELANTGAGFDLYVTTVADNGLAEPDFEDDTDLDIDQAGTLTVTINADTAVTVNDITVEGDYTVGGDDDITVSGDVNVEGAISGTLDNVAADADLTFRQLGGNLTMNIVGSGTAGVITFTNGSTGVATLTVNGSLAGLVFGDASDNKNGDLGGALTINADGDIGDVTIDGDATQGISWTADSFGDITVSDNAFGDGSGTGIRATAGAIGNITATGDIDLVTIEAQNTAAQGDATIGRISGTNIGDTNALTISAGGDIGDILASGTLGDNGTQVTITSQTGGLGDITVNGDVVGEVINADVDVDDDIGNITATVDNTNVPIIAGDFRSITGNIGNISLIEGDITANFTAVSGSIGTISVLDGADTDDAIPDAGNIISGTIEASGDIGDVQAGALGGTYIAGGATAASPVANWTFGDVKYSLEAENATGAGFGYTFTGGTIDLSIDNSGGDTTAIDLMLKTVDAGGVVEAGDELLDNTQFNLNSLNFSAGADDLGLLHVEGDISGPVVVGSVSSLIVEDDIQVPVELLDNAANPITAIAAGAVQGDDDPTAAQLDSAVVGTTVAYEAPAVGDEFTVPVSTFSTGNDVSFAIAGDSGFGTPIVLGVGTTATVGSFDVTVGEEGALQVDGTRTLNGNLTIDGDLDYTLLGEDLDAVTITGSVLEAGGINAYDIGALTIGTANDLTTGNMDGTIRSVTADDDAGPGGNDDGNIGAITIFGNVGSNGLIYAEGTITSLTVGQVDYDFQAEDQRVGDFAGTLETLDAAIGGITINNNFSGVIDIADSIGAVAIYNDMTGSIAALGDITSVTSTEGDIGGSGAIMAGGSLNAVTANNGTISADLFIGGAFNDDVVLQAQSITGDLMIGTAAGVDSLTMNLMATNDDADPITYAIAGNNNASRLVVDIEAGGVTSTGLTIDSINVLADDDLNVTADNENAVTVDEIFILTNYDNTITVDGNVGTIVGAVENDELMTTAEMQTAFINAYNTDNDPDIAFDVVSDTAPTTVDALLNNINDVDLDVDLTVDNVTGIIATGDLDVSAAGIDTLGYMVSLNGTFDSDSNIVADDSVGSIAASGNIAGTINVEGPVAIDDGTAAAAAVAGYGLTGLPSGFAGGILSENGDITPDITANAAASSQLMGIWIPDGYALGQITAMNGEVGGTYDLSGDFGGILAPLDDLNANTTPTVNVDPNSEIDIFVAPYTGGGVIAGNHPDAQIQLINGEIVITSSSSYNASNSDVSVTASGATTLAWITATGATINTLNVYNGLAADGQIDVVGTGVTTVTVDGDLAAGSAMNIAGAVTTMTVNGDWAGDVSLDAQGELMAVTTINLNGDVDAATAMLNAANFTTLNHNGDVLNPGVDTQFSTGTLDFDDNSVTFTNTNGDQQTVGIVAGRNVEADYEINFGKMTSLDIVGRGGVSVASVHDDALSVRDMRTILRDTARNGMPDDEGTAHLGDVTTQGWQTINFKGFIVDGSMQDLRANGKAAMLYINGAADEVKVSRNINGLFSAGGINELNSDVIKDVFVDGSVADIDVQNGVNIHVINNVTDLDAVKLARVQVNNNVTNLNMGFKGALISCNFGSVANDNIDNRRWIEGSDTEPGAGGGDAAASNGVWRNENPAWNPVKIANTVAPGLTPYGPATIINQ